MEYLDYKYFDKQVNSQDARHRVRSALFSRYLKELFDTFRQYDGWSRLFIYMKRWGDVVRACRDKPMFICCRGWHGIRKKPGSGGSPFVMGDRKFLQLFLTGILVET